MTDITRHRAYLFVDHSDDPYLDGDTIERWGKKWGAALVKIDAKEYGYEVEAPLAALQELPKRLFAHGTGTTYPFWPDGLEHAEWGGHFDDGKVPAWKRRVDA